MAQGFAERRKSSSSRLQQVAQSDDKCPEREAYKGERIGSKDGPSEAADAREQTTGEKRRKAASSGTGAGRREEVCVGSGVGVVVVVEEEWWWLSCLLRTRYFFFVRDFFCVLRAGCGNPVGFRMPCANVTY